MAKNKDNKTTTPGGDGQPTSEPGAPSAGTQPQLNVLGQYIKDLSFENPGAPGALRAPGENPQLQVSVNVNTKPQSEDEFEVALNIEVHAKNDAGPIYNVELVYCGLFRLRNVPPNLLQPVLLVDCPALMFPFMRRVLADITRDGGFPPLMLDPIDFGRLYTENVARQAAAQTKN